MKNLLLALLLFIVFYSCEKEKNKNPYYWGNATALKDEYSWESKSIFRGQ